jgi:hypothetical protein
MRFPALPGLFLALGIAALASCGRGEVAPPSPTGPTGPTGPTEPTGPTGSCSSLTRLHCHASKDCFLDHAKPYHYSCREKRGPCEVDLLQTDEAGCRARPGCEWDPGSCYCPFAGYGETAVPDPPSRQGAACACGGGPPARCKERK